MKVSTEAFFTFIVLVVMTSVWSSYYSRWASEYNKIKEFLKKQDEISYYGVNTSKINFLFFLASKNLIRFRRERDDIELIKTGEPSQNDRKSKDFFNSVFDLAHKSESNVNTIASFESVSLRDIAYRYNEWIDNKLRYKNIPELHTKAYIIGINLLALIMSLVCNYLDGENLTADVIMLAIVAIIGAVLWIVGMILFCGFFPDAWKSRKTNSSKDNVILIVIGLIFLCWEIGAMSMWMIFCEDICTCLIRGYAILLTFVSLILSKKKFLTNDMGMKKYKFEQEYMMEDTAGDGPDVIEICDIMNRCLREE